MLLELVSKLRAAVLAWQFVCCTLDKIILLLTLHKTFQPASVNSVSGLLILIEATPEDSASPQDI